MCRMELKERNLKYKGHRVKVFEDVIKGPEGEMLYYDFVEKCFSRLGLFEDSLLEERSNCYVLSKKN